ncbi:MAG: hypothetical protein P1V97_24390 [Planctomycetota bacterium]|nr:hypothetical protein [Planctomycetota bacterium]
MWRPPFRYLSSWLDDAVLNGSVVLEQRRAFADTKVAQPPPFEQLIQEITEKTPLIHWAKKRTRFFWDRIPVSLRSLPYESYIDFHKSPGPNADTLVVYHHGLGEIPHDTLPHVLFRHPKLRARCDWIAIKGIHHKSWAEVSGRLLRDRNTFIRSLVASAGVCKQIVQDIGPRYKHVVMVGTSMGGIISLVESCHEPQFQLYVPFIAGPNLADVMLKSSFRCMIHGAFRRRERQSPWLHELDMTWRLEGQSGPPIRPLLARSDRLFRYEAQVKCYERIQRAEIATFEGGHITGAVNLPAFAKHVVSMINKNCWEATPKTAAKLSEMKIA